MINRHLHWNHAYPASLRTVRSELLKSAMRAASSDAEARVARARLLGGVIVFCFVVVAIDAVWRIATWSEAALIGGCAAAGAIALRLLLAGEHPSSTASRDTQSWVDQRRADQSEAEHARGRMADFAQASNDWFWEADSAGNLSYLSELFEAATGVPIASQIGARRLDLNCELDPTNPNWDQHLASIRARQPFRDFVMEVRFEYGPKHLSFSGKPIFDPAGRFAGYRGTSRDVTAEIEAQRILARHTETLSSLIEHLPLGVSLIGPDLRVRAFNQHYVDLFGLPSGFLTPGDSIEKIVRFCAERGDYGPGLIEAVVQRNLSRLRSSDVQHFERTRQDGQIVEIRRMPLSDGSCVSTRIDVTERRHRERDLREAHAQLQQQTATFSTLIENLPVGVSLVGHDLRFMAFNRLFLDFFDLPSDLFKVGDSFESFIHYNAVRGEYGPGDIDEQVRERIVRAVDPRPNYFERTRPNGRVVEIRRAAVPSGGFVTSYIDVTEARHRETDLEDARLRLELQAQALVAATQKLNAANKAKSLFLANMSHELRTPLNAVIGFSEVMRDAVIGTISSKYREYACDIHSSGSYLLRLINDVLDTSKIEVGQLDLHEDDVELTDLAHECERLLRDRAHDGHVTLEMNLPPDLPLLHADRLRIKQVLLNLLSNAVKFTAPGGHVSLRVRSIQSGIEMAIADTGIGMQPEDIPLALEPFRQLDNSLARRYEGTGLGLPLSKALIELHGGRLEIESTPGKGTTVRVTLPLERIIVNRSARVV